jgi:hypothetical protein
LVFQQAVRGALSSRRNFPHHVAALEATAVFTESRAGRLNTTLLFAWDGAWNVAGMSALLGLGRDCAVMSRNPEETADYR